MATIPCPQCGELNEANAVHCAACGSKLDEPARPRPIPFGELLQTNVRNLLWLGVGVILLALGLYAPWLGSAIIQFLLIFSDNGPSHGSGSSEPSAADAWLVFAMAGLCFLVGGVGLYLSLSKFWARRLGVPETEPQDAPGE